MPCAFWEKHEQVNDDADDEPDKSNQNAFLDAVLVYLLEIQVGEQDGTEGHRDGHD